MTRRRQPIEFSARAVVAAGEPFLPRGAPMSDPDVALDEILSLRAGPEPVVLRVKASGLGREARARVEGDWLCDPGEEPVRLPRPRWSFDRNAEWWSRRRTWLDAWEQCGEARVLIYAAASVGVDDKVVVAAACACVRRAVSSLPPGHPSPAGSLEVAERWSSSGATMDELERAMDDATRAASAATVTSGPAYGTLNLLHACSVASRTPFGPMDRATFSFGVATALANAESSALGLMAPIVKSRIPTLSVLRAAASPA